MIKLTALFIAWAVYMDNFSFVCYGILFILAILFWQERKIILEGSNE